jgi:HKD family nuclease
MPFEGQSQDSDPFLEVLNHQFDQDNYTNIIFMSAWTRLWPIDQINESLVEYLTGGGRFTLYTGNSFRSTSIEAMDHMMHLAAQFPGQVHVYVCAQNTGSFHPKVYSFINSDDRTSWLSIGSSNLTRGGMDTNIEANLISMNWEEMRAVVNWWRNRPDSVRQVRLTPHHLGTEAEPGPLREMFRTEEAISNQGNQTGDTAAHDLQLIQTYAIETVDLGAEEQESEAEQPVLQDIVEELFIKRIHKARASSHDAGYMDLSLPVVRNGFFGNHPLPNPATGSQCIGRVNLNLVVNGAFTGAQIEEWNTGEGARLFLDDYDQERFNLELPQFSYKVFIRTTPANGSQIYVWFITPTHHVHPRINQMFEAHEEICPGPLPAGRRNDGLNVVYLRGDVAGVATIVNQLRHGLGEDFVDVLRQTMQADPDLQTRIGD